MPSSSLARAHLLLCLPLCLSACHRSRLSPHHPISLSLTLPVPLSLALSPRLTPSPAHHILLQPINNFWAIAPGPRWARPLGRRCPAQPLNAPAASSKVQAGLSQPLSPSGGGGGRLQRKAALPGSLAQEKGVTFASDGTGGDGQALAAPGRRC